MATFRKGLSETGFVEGLNVAIEYRWARNDSAKLPALAADLVRRRVAVIVALGTAGSLAAKAATNTIPIVFTTGADAVQAGLVRSYNSPGGNVTGFSSMSSELGPKQLELLHKLVPEAARFAALVNPNARDHEFQVTNMQAAAASVGRQIEVFYAATDHDIDTAFASLVQKRADALWVSSAALFINSRVQIVILAARPARPAIYPFRQFAEAGGLMSYGLNLDDNTRWVGIYTGRILKGEKPAGLPVMQTTKFHFVINLQTAKALGIEVPPTLLALADEVIE